MNETPESKRNQLLLPVLLFCASFCLLTALWFLLVYQRYAPSGDEFSLLVHSTRFFHPSWKTWFLEGFRPYFQPYPDLESNQTDFIRPVANLTYWFDSWIFGRHWSSYLLTTYFIQSAIVALTAWIARTQLRLSTAFSIGLALLAMLSPAFALNEFVTPSFAFDLLASLLVLLALGCLLQRWRAACWFFLLLAVFTKETALFAPIAAAVAVWQQDAALPAHRRAAWPAFFLLPLVAWYSVRRAAFQGHSGVYVLNNSSLSVLVKDFLHGFLAWPFGMRNIVQPYSVRFIYFFLDASFWVVLAVCVYTWLSHKKTSPAYTFLNENKYKIVCLFCALSLLMPLVLSLQQRFGGVFYPLLYLTVGYVAAQTTLRSANRAARITLVLLGLVAAVQKLTPAVSLQETARIWRFAGSYIDQIHASNATMLLVWNDISGGFSSEESIAAFAGYRGKLIRVSDFQPSRRMDCARFTQSIPSVVAALPTLQSETSAQCGDYTFYGPVFEYMDAQHGVLHRQIGDLSMQYRMPLYKPSPVTKLPELQGEMSVDLSGAPRDTEIMRPDLQNEAFVRSTLFQ